MFRSEVATQSTRTNLFRSVIAASLLIVAAAAIAPAAHAQVAAAGSDPFAASDSVAAADQMSDRLMIVNRNTGRVISDGRNDLFCATRVYIAGYNDWGRPIYRRSMRCR
jgi:hypothetical protein